MEEVTAKSILEKDRHRPQFEIDDVMALALARYMQDEGIGQQSVVMRRALRQVIPVKFIDDARRELQKERNGSEKRKRR